MLALFIDHFFNFIGKFLGWTYQLITNITTLIYIVGGNNYLF